MTFLKKTLPLLLVLFSLTGLTYGQEGISAEELNSYTTVLPLDAYVEYKDPHVTSEELTGLDFSKIIDTTGQTIDKYSVYRCQVMLKRKEGTRIEHVAHCGLELEADETVQSQYRKLMDSLSKTLSLGDTVSIGFTLYQPNRQDAPYQVMKEDVLESEDIYDVIRLVGENRSQMILQPFVISSRTVVYLKRNPNGMGVVAVYPSPAKDEVSVRFDLEETAEGNLTLLDQQGKALATVHHNDLLEPYTFKMTEHPAGTYFVRAEIDGEFFVKKFIKQ